MPSGHTRDVDPAEGFQMATRQDSMRFSTLEIGEWVRRAFRACRARAATCEKRVDTNFEIRKPC